MVDQAALLKWFAGPGVGSSSKLMACVAAGIKYEDRFDDKPHPHDPDDMNRCLKLMAAVPGVRGALGEVAKVSPVWAALIARWDEIEASFLAEAGIDWSKSRSAPKTYKLMQSIIRPIEDKDPSILRFGEGVTIKFGV